MSAPALVILAAGASTRLGSCKALADLGRTTPLAALLAAGAGLEALVVAGAHVAAIRAALPANVECVHNELWSSGRLSSVQAADLCIAPVDVPLVPAEVFALLSQAWEAAGTPEHGWLAPRCDGRHGHPIVIGRALAARILESPSELPLKSFRAGAYPLLALEVQAREILDDLDSPEDLARLRARRGF